MLHQVGVSFDLHCDARKHKIKTKFFIIEQTQRGRRTSRLGSRSGGDWANTSHWAGNFKNILFKLELVAALLLPHFLLPHIISRGGLYYT